MVLIYNSEIKKIGCQEGIDQKNGGDCLLTKRDPVLVIGTFHFAKALAVPPIIGIYGRDNFSDCSTYISSIPKPRQLSH